MQHRSVFVASIVLSLCAAACTVGPDDAGGGGHADAGGGGGDSGSTTTGGAIRIDPADADRTIEGVPVVIDYRAFVSDGHGGEREITSDVTWSLTTPDLGSFSGARFTSTATLGGRTSIRATMGSLEGTTSLMLRLQRQILTPGTPADAPSRFGGTPDPAYAPELVYPEDQTMVPPNLGELEFHYRTGGNTVFELHVETPSVDLRIYFGCPEAVGGGCIYTPDRDTWETIATAAQGLGPITWTLRGADDAGHLGEAASRTLLVSEEPITGGLYYWNAGGGSIDRFEFGVRGAVAERFLTRASTGATTCVGCHALSRDGRRIAVGTDIPTTTLQAFDVATRTRIWQLGGGGIGGFPMQSNFNAWSTDGSFLVGSSAMGLFVRDGNTGMQMAGPLGGGPSEMPDVSPDGMHIVYVRHDAAAPGGLLYDFTSVQSGRIARLDWNGTEWVPGGILAAGGGNNYYPAYSPDGAWVVFNRSPSDTPSMGMDSSSSMTAYVADAQLWVVRADGSAPPMLMSRAGGLADAWPKFDPTLYRDRDRDLFWMAWSSRRALGLRYAEGGSPQLWMAAFDPEEAAAGHEATYAAFRLPFQDISTGNHIAQWVTTVERMTCTGDADCGGEFCVDGRCYEHPPLY